MTDVPTIDLQSLLATGIVFRNTADPEAILRLASDLAADLIVMGVRGFGAFAQTASRFGSTAHKVISEARCPVLTVTDANHAGGQ